MTRVDDAHAILNQSATQVPDTFRTSLLVDGDRRLPLAINIGAALLPVIDVGPAPTSARRIQRVGLIRRRAGGAHIPRTRLLVLLVLRVRCGAAMEDDHDVHSEPISIARCRDLLGPDADGLSDVEVDQIRRHADLIAHVIVETFLEQRAAQE